MPTSLPNANVSSYGSTFIVSGTGGGGGTPGSIWINPTSGTTGVVGATGTYYSAATTYSTPTVLQSDKMITPDLVLTRAGKPDLKVGQALDVIMDRLCVLQPSFEKLEKYPALREAYENYKLIEAMLIEGENKNGL